MGRCINYICLLGFLLASALEAEPCKFITIEAFRRQLLLGPEVTFTNHRLWNLPHILEKKAPRDFEAQARRAESHRQNMKHYELKFSSADRRAVIQKMLSIPEYLTPLQAESIWDFLQNVLVFEEAKLFLFPGQLTIVENKRAYTMHTSNAWISFWVRNHLGEEMTLNLEPGAIEINRAPVHQAKLRERWFHLFRRAKAFGFVGSIWPLEGGGGGHLHLGFESPETNIFLQRPRTLANLALMPLLAPEGFLNLREISDFGDESTAHTIFDMGISPQREIELKSLLRLANPRLTRYSTIVQSLTDNLKDHNSGISFKNATEDDANPRVELRYPRAYTDYEDLEALGELGLRMVWMAANMDPANLSRSRELIRQNVDVEMGMISSDALHANADGFYKAIGVASRYRKRLLNLGGASIVNSDLPLRTEVSGVRVRRHPGYGHLTNGFELTLPLNGDLHPLRALVNGSEAFMVRRSDKVYIFFNPHPTARHDFLIRLEFFETDQAKPRHYFLKSDPLGELRSFRLFDLQTASEDRILFQADRIFPDAGTLLGLQDTAAWANLLHQMLEIGRPDWIEALFVDYRSRKTSPVTYNVNDFQEADLEMVTSLKCGHRVFTDFEFYYDGPYRTLTIEGANRDCLKFEMRDKRRRVIGTLETDKLFYDSKGL